MGGTVCIRHYRFSLWSALLAAILVFEIDIRLFSDWRVRADSESVMAGRCWYIALAVHLVFAVSTLVLLLWVLIEAVLRFPKPPVPGSHSRRHRLMARFAATDLLITTVTGGFFYWLAFVV